jgi:hypothetical protein
MVLLFLVVSPSNGHGGTVGLPDEQCQCPSQGGDHRSYGGDDSHAAALLSSEWPARGICVSRFVRILEADMPAFMTVDGGTGIQESVQQALAGAAGQPTEVVAAVGQAAASAAVAAEIPPPTQEAAGQLWLALVITLCVILVVDLAAIIYALVDKRDTDVLVGIFTTALSGLLGLFVRPPAQATT